MVKLKKTLYTLVLIFIITSFLVNIFLFNSRAQPNLTVHNVNTGLNYTTIQEAINAPETLDGHTILVDSGTYYENVVLNKSLSLIGQDMTNTIIDGNGTGTVVHVTADNVNITGFTIQNLGIAPPPSLIGIYILLSSGNNISHNILSKNNFGIWLSGCINNVIADNNIFLNKYSGITISDSSGTTLSANNVSNNNYGITFAGSNNNVLVDNSVFSNSRDGIYLYSSNSNLLLSNKVFLNINSGIWFSESSSNYLAGNEIYLGAGDGIRMYNSTNNYLVNSNDIYENDQTGITLNYSDGNTIFHNNFVNNTISLTVINSTTSLDNSLEGNYWSDYNGSDENEDGIGDVPYLIDEYNNDTYPLMGNFSDFGITKEEQIDSIYTISNSTISNLSFNETECTVKFSVAGIDNTTGFCRIMIPEILISGPYITLIDDKEINATVLPISNATNAFLYFLYNHSEHQVTIICKSYYELLQKYNKLLEEYQSLNLTCQELLGNYSKLLTDFENVLIEYENLTSMHDELSINYTLLQSDYEALNGTYSELLRGYTQLQLNYSSLQINYGVLSDQYELLNSTYYALNSSYSNLLSFRDELESKYNLAINELANIKTQVYLFVGTVTIVLIALASLSMKYYKMFNEQKKILQTYKRQLEKINHLEVARSSFELDVKKRRAKIEKFERKYHVSIKPSSTMEDILKSIKLKENSNEG